ncbi:hypothetical protein L6164_036015 [Bauhinia variegata]|uniref:Uncharacterized protein n=1 Tax=Bauhinia variegata TaxID=167791 RepID=A0ACB9KFT8_BAUVA|nr:hypothetical protein L6164_036015 [Bauhinia variegata]
MLRILTALLVLTIMSVQSSEGDGMGLWKRKGGGGGGEDCKRIQVSQPFYLPNTVRDHASFAFNNYYQKFKHKGATCYFNAAAISADLDPNKTSI